MKPFSNSLSLRQMNFAAASGGAVQQLRQQLLESQRDSPAADGSNTQQIGNVTIHYHKWWLTIGDNRVL